MASSESNGDVFLWLKSMPVAPEYRPSVAEFQDPIGYIFKIEKEASKYGICKIIPPYPPSSKKTAMANLNRSLAKPTFTTRQQQIGFCPRKNRPVQRPVWQSGGTYTFQEFQSKAKSFEKTYIKKHTKKGSGLGPLETETLFWKATVDKPFSVEYANDMPGSAFAAAKCRDAGNPSSLADTAWNMRTVSRTNGSLLRFMKEEIPGVTSPMVYLAMLFSWFAWHVEDHDLHSLNYLHMGAGKTWYGVPRDAAVAFEEVVRVHGYGGEINPLVTFATLGEKTTVMSPEVFISAGVPCCRLVQNAGEFVVTFPRAYHAGFSHGFNCGEAANIATPEWLRIAKDAAIRRASINYPPMVSHFQLLYDLALALCSRIPGSIRAEPRSSRLKDKKKGEGETVIKELFVQDVLQNNDLLHVLGKGSAVVLLPRSSVDISVCSKLRVGSQKVKVNPRFSVNVCNSQGMNSSKGFGSGDLAFNKNNGIKQEKCSYPVNSKFNTLWERNGICSVDVNGNRCASSSKLQKRDIEGEISQGDVLSDQRLFACVTCGILSFSCVAIVQPTEPAARYLMSADCTSFNDWVVDSGVSSNKFTDAREDATIPDPNMYTGWMEKNAEEGLYDVPVQSDQYGLQNADKKYKVALEPQREKGNTALALLVSAYGNSDSEEDQDDPDTAVDGHESTAINSASGRSPFRDSHASPVTRLDKGDGVSSMGANQGDYMHCRSECDLSHQSFDHPLEEQDCDISSGFTFMNMTTVPISTSSCSQDAHDVEKSFSVKARVPVDNKNALLVPLSDEDSSRMHVFCLEHAAEAEQNLRQIGGADILLLCHPDYPKIEAEAKLVAEDLGIDYIWKNIAYRPVVKEDEERIQGALDCEEAIPGNGDWAVKLGINLFYSATLSRSPLYSKQMPCNYVIYHAFGCSSPATSPTEPKVYQRRANKPKKVVAGKWCGKVWMSNQVHHLLAKRDSGNVEDEKGLHGLMLPDETIENSENTPERETAIRKSGKKRKMTVKSGRTRKGKFAEKDSTCDHSTKDKPNPQSRRTLRSKHAAHVETDDATFEGDSSPPCHGRKTVSKQTNRNRSDALSDDLLDDNVHMRHSRDVSVKNAKFVEHGAVSDGTVDYDSHWQQMEDHSCEQVEDTERDAFSDDILDASSLQLHRKTSKGKQAKHISECVISDDQMENHFQKKQRRIPKGRQGKYLGEEDIMISDDQLELNMQKQRLKNPKSRQAKYLADANIISHDQLEGHCRKYQKRKPKCRQAKCVAGEDAMSDDQLQDHFRKQQTTFSRRQNKGIEMEVKNVMSDDQSEDHFQDHHRRFTRSRLNKCADEPVPDDLVENNTYLLHRTAKRRKVKCMDEDDVISDDGMENGFRQQDKRTLPGKQSKPKTLQQMKQANSFKKNQTSWPVKRGAQKSKAPQQIKLASHLQNKELSNSRESNLHMEEEEEGGPSTRLRKRVPKATEGKFEDKQTKRKKVKNAKVTKVSAGHGKMKDEEAEYQCDIEECTMSFGAKQELVLHKRNICPMKGCGKKFFSHKYLVQHRRVHEDDRPLRCPWKGCKMTFKWSWARTEHIRVHTGARPYACAEPGCGQTFRFVSDFSRHKRKTGHSVKKSR